MKRRTFLGTVAASGLALAIADALGRVTVAGAEPMELAAHPRLIVTDFGAVADMIATNADAGRWYAALKPAADKVLDLPPLTYEIPDKVRLLAVCNEMRFRTHALSVAHAVEGGTTYRDRLWADLEAVSRFPDWNANRHFLDVGTMISAVALAYDWWYDDWTADQRALVENAIVEFALKPGLAVYEGRARGDFHTSTNNWNPVCNGGLIMGALAVADVEPDLAQQIIDYAREALPLVLDQYAPDGGYPEAAYWLLSTQYVALLIESLKTATGDRALIDTPGLDVTGTFPIQLTGPTGAFFNSGDGTSAPMQRPTLFWLARAFQQPLFGWWAKLGIDAATSSSDTMYKQYGLTFLWCDPELVDGPIELGTPRESFFVRPQVATMRSGWERADAVYLGGKGGSPSASHGDCDLGTFVLDALGEAWATDFGSDSYNLTGYWDNGPYGQRWDYYRKRAEGHNTVVIDPGAGPDQDPDAEGTVIAHESSVTEAYAIAELSTAHPKLRSWRRGWRLFDDRSQVLVQDEITTDEAADVWWFLHTEARLSISADGRSATLSRNGQRLLARVISPADATFYDCPSDPLWFSPHRTGETEYLRRHRKLAVHLTDVRATTIAVQLSPLHAGEEPTHVTRIEQLSRWQASGREPATLASLAISDVPLAGFSENNFRYQEAIPAGASIRAVPTDPGARVEIREGSGTEPTRIRVTARGKATGWYWIWPTADSGLGDFTDTIIASENRADSPPRNSMDGRLDTFWSAPNDDEWIAYDMGGDGPIDRVTIAWFFNGDGRRYRFDLQVAGDGDVAWRTVFSGESAGTAADPETFAFEPTTARYLRVVGHGSTANQWTKIMELAIPGRTVDLTGPDPYLSTLTVQVERLAPGAEARATVTGELSDGSAADLSDVDLTWETADPGTASVTSDGVVTGRAEGTTRLAVRTVTAERKLVWAAIDVDVMDPLRPWHLPVADAFVRDGGFAESNFGTSGNLLVKSTPGNTGETQVGLIEFRVPAPEGTVATVTLRLYCRTEPNHSYPLHLSTLTGAFAEEVVTWQTRPAPGPVIGTAQVGESWSWHEFDVTDAALAAIQAGDPIRFGLSEPLEDGRAGKQILVMSRETDKGPQLQLTLS